MASRTCIRATLSIVIVLMALGLFTRYFSNRLIDAQYTITVKTAQPANGPFLVHSVFECPSLHNSRGCHAAKFFVPANARTTQAMGKAYGYFGHRAWLGHPDYLSQPLGGGGTYRHWPAFHVVQQTTPVSWRAAIKDIGSPAPERGAHKCFDLRQCHSAIFQHLRWLEDDYVPRLVEQGRRVPDYRETVTFLEEYYFKAYSRYPEHLDSSDNDFPDSRVLGAYRTLMYGYEQMYPSGNQGVYRPERWLGKDPLYSLNLVRRMMMSDRDNAILDTASRAPQDSAGNLFLEPERLVLRWKGSGDVAHYEVTRSVGRSVGWGASRKCDGHSISLSIRTRRDEEHSHLIDKHRAPCSMRLYSSEWGSWVIDVDDLVASKDQLLQRLDKLFSQRRREIENSNELLVALSSAEAGKRSGLPGAEKWLEQYSVEQQAWLPRIVRQEYNDSLHSIAQNLKQALLDLSAVDGSPSLSHSELGKEFAGAIEILLFSQDQLRETFRRKWAAAVSGNTVAFFQLANDLMSRDDYRRARQLFNLMPPMDEEDRKRAKRLVYR